MAAKIAYKGSAQAVLDVNLSEFEINFLSGPDENGTIEMDLSGEDGHLTLRFTPQDPAVVRYLNIYDINGGINLEKIHEFLLTDRLGPPTLITFSAEANSPSPFRCFFYSGELNLL